MESDEKKKKVSTAPRRNPNPSSPPTPFRAGDLDLRDGAASNLVGRILEKGISDELPPTTYFSPIPPPKPSVLPFPVARHRSHGPHWAPFGSVASSGNGEDGDEEEDDLMNCDPISALADPLRRKNRKDMDFSSWKDLLSVNSTSVVAEKPKATRSSSAKTGNLKRDRNSVETARNNTESSSVAAKLPESVGDVKREMDYTALPVASSGSNLRYEQEVTSLESEIDAENRERLKGMSHDEIAEAQAEIMEKMDPAFLRRMKKRGEERLQKKKPQISEVVADVERSNRCLDEKRDAGVSGAESPINDVKATHNDLQSEVGSGTGRNSDPASGSLWNTWSARVERAREIRFSLDGTVLEYDLLEVTDIDCVASRDLLRTEGDPGAAGYTIKEAVALTRSVIPGQRAIALHLLFAVLDKAVHNICQGQVGSSTKNDDKINRSTDWEAIWAYALGPEPELILSLRICLDDNHHSVALACAKVIQCILTCDVNDKFSDLSEKITTFKDICTAPVFRSRPEIDVGFLHGGFWKYNAKCSNILTLDDDIIDDETEGKNTIQDDIFVAGQDFAAGLVRMGILPRLRYLLESDPTAGFEECLVSILVAIARHSPTCANAIMKCQRLVEIVVQRFAKNGSVQIQPSMMKSVTLIKVLSRSDSKYCMEFLNNRIFLTITMHLYKRTPSLDHWIKSGQENCKLLSALVVEQLRFWRVCVQHGQCVSFFSDIFTSLCLWLNPPPIDMLIENDLLTEFASISADAFLVLEALASRLPSFFSRKHPNNEIKERVSDETDIWSWSHVGPMVDSAIMWIVFMGGHDLQGPHLISLLWVYSAVMSMLVAVFKRIIPEDGGSSVPWLPEFVPKIGLEIIKNKFLSFSDDFGVGIAEDGSLIEKLMHFRHRNDEASLASVCCAHNFLKAIVSIDSLIQSAKKGILSSQEVSLSNGETILRDGIIKGSLVELKIVLRNLTKIIASEWQIMQSIEIFGRGGPAPGVGVGWGAPIGGFWSTHVLLAQADAGLTVELLETLQNLSGNEVPLEEEIDSAVQRINSSLAACLLAGPRNRNVAETAFRALSHVSVLKCLDLCIRKFLHFNRRFKPFEWEYKEEDFLRFSEILTSHFSKRWLSVKKRKLKTADDTFKRSKGSLDPIHEELDVANTAQNTSLCDEWAHQRLPLPVTWFLSPFATLCNSKEAGLKKSANIENIIQNPVDMLEVSSAGLFFLLGIETMSDFLPNDVPYLVRNVPLVWKLHSLSVALLCGMAVIEENKSRDVFELLQDLYGVMIDEARLNETAVMTCEDNVTMLPETTDKKNVELLRFRSEIHDSYTTFIETLVEQFSAVSYGDLVYSRQIAIYLHRSVEASVRLSAWNVLMNARVLELLPPLESCFGKSEGYLQPNEDNGDILEAYVKSWTCGALDKAATRQTIAFTLVLHHVSQFIFCSGFGDKQILRDKLARSLLRDFSQKQQHKIMMLNLVRYNEHAPSSHVTYRENTTLPVGSYTDQRIEVLTEACGKDSSLLNEVNNLKSLL